jgi:hypothetical protein
VSRDTNSRSYKHYIPLGLFPLQSPKGLQQDYLIIVEAFRVEACIVKKNIMSLLYILAA